LVLKDDDGGVEAVDGGASGEEGLGVGLPGVVAGFGGAGGREGEVRIAVAAGEGGEEKEC